MYTPVRLIVLADTFVVELQMPWFDKYTSELDFKDILSSTPQVSVIVL
jgi:hypothetical protein